MGKKSRRQREKDPVTGLRKVLRREAANSQLGNVSPQELRKLANEVLDSQDPNRADDDDDDDDSELDAVQDAEPKPTVAEAEAEYNAAMTPGGFKEDWVQAAAMMSLRAALTIDQDDKNNFDAYMGIVQPSISAPDKLLKAMKRWPRYRKYWPRIRRRICWGCGKQYALSEPRIWVCGGCGEARYCDEACQRAHWPAHKTPCLKTFHEKTKKSLSRGVSVEKLRQAYLEAYHDDGAARVFSAMDKK